MNKYTIENGFLMERNSEDLTIRRLTTYPTTKEKGFFWEHKGIFGDTLIIPKKNGRLATRDDVTLLKRTNRGIVYQYKDEYFFFSFDLDDSESLGTWREGDLFLRRNGWQKIAMIFREDDNYSFEFLSFFVIEGGHVFFEITPERYRIFGGNGGQECTSEYFAYTLEKDQKEATRVFFYRERNSYHGIGRVKSLILFNNAFLIDAGSTGFELYGFEGDQKKLLQRGKKFNAHPSKGEFMLDHQIWFAEDDNLCILEHKPRAYAPKEEPADQGVVAQEPKKKWWHFW